MPINATEVGKTFRYATGFDMSASTDLILHFTHSDGVTTFTATNPAVTAPAVPVTDPDLGSLLASEYMEYLTTGTDFTKGGDWTVCGTYEDATPKKFFGGDAVFNVGDAC
jgi:hypothetical protein